MVRAVRSPGLSGAAVAIVPAAEPGSKSPLMRSARCGLATIPAGEDQAKRRWNRSRRPTAHTRLRLGIVPAPCCRWARCRRPERSASRLPPPAATGPARRAAAAAHAAGRGPGARPRRPPRGGGRDDIRACWELGDALITRAHQEPTPDHDPLPEFSDTLSLASSRRDSGPLVVTGWCIATSTRRGCSGRRRSGRRVRLSDRLPGSGGRSPPSTPAVTASGSRRCARTVDHGASPPKSLT